MRVKIPKANNINDIIDPIREAYETIYEDPEKFGVWGHTIDQ